MTSCGKAQTWMPANARPPQCGAAALGSPWMRALQKVNLDLINPSRRFKFAFTAM